MVDSEDLSLLGLQLYTSGLLPKRHYLLLQLDYLLLLLPHHPLEGVISDHRAVALLLHSQLLSCLPHLGLQPDYLSLQLFLFLPQHLVVAALLLQLLPQLSFRAPGVELQLLLSVAALF